MKQSKFISTSYQINPQGGINQTDKGKVIVNLRPGIQIIHDYHKHDQIVVSFSDINDSFKLTSDDQLEEIYKLHLGKINLTEPLHQYCVDNLEKI